MKENKPLGETPQLEFPKEADLSASENRSIAEAGTKAQEVATNNIMDARLRLQNFNKILARKPPLSLVRNMSQGGQSYNYMPIRYYERLMMQLFFGRVKYEIVKYGNIFNEVVVHSRVHYFHPVTMEWMFVDGIAAHQIMQDKDTKVAEFATYKKPNALKTVLPACYSESVKNACKKLGAIFGGDVNRKPEDDYDAFSNSVKVVNQ